jgi:hypothetical protein
VQDALIKLFHRTTCDEVVSADKMMIHARGPVWPRQPQQQGIIPEGLHGLDTEATWSDRQSDGWVYGPGTCGRVAWKHCLLGPFKWMRNSGHAATRRWLETGQLTGLLTTVLRDSQADDQAWFFERQRQRTIRLRTTTRNGQDKRPKRKRRIKVRQKQTNTRLYKQRSYTVEPMPGRVQDIFELERCWRRGHENHRWLFAAMGVVVQMHQYRAWTEGRSTWAIQQEVLGR